LSRKPFLSNHRGGKSWSDQSAFRRLSDSGKSLGNKCFADWSKLAQLIAPKFLVRLSFVSHIGLLRCSFEMLFSICTRNQGNRGVPAGTEGQAEALLLGYQGSLSICHI